MVTFNPGVSLIRHTEAEDYTAGELNEPFKYLPGVEVGEGLAVARVDVPGSQLGGTRTPASHKEWADWTKAVLAKEGVVTFDVGPNLESSGGPVGSIASAQVKVLKTIRDAVRGIRRHGQVIEAVGELLRAAL